MAGDVQQHGFHESSLGGMLMMLLFESGRPHRREVLAAPPGGALRVRAFRDSQRQFHNARATTDAGPADQLADWSRCSRLLRPRRSDDGLAGERQTGGVGRRAERRCANGEIWIWEAAR
jgi:hypothetical protein